MICSNLGMIACDFYAWTLDNQPNKDFVAAYQKLYPGKHPNAEVYGAWQAVMMYLEGVKAALENLRLGLVDNWLRHIQDVRQKHRELLATITDPEIRHDRLCELNVIEQVLNVCHTTAVREAWDRGQEVTVHGWVYGLADGLAHDMHISVSSHQDTHAAYEAAIAQIG